MEHIETKGSGVDPEKYSGNVLQSVSTPSSSSRRRFAYLAAFCAAISLAAITIRQASIFGDELISKTPIVREAICPKTIPLSPLAHSSLLTELETEYATQGFKTHAYDSLGGAVKIPLVTMCFVLHRYSCLIQYRNVWWYWGTRRGCSLGCVRRFPLVPRVSLSTHVCRNRFIPISPTNFTCRHQNLNQTKVNTYGSVYQWQGSKTDVKPILFTAHQGQPCLVSNKDRKKWQIFHCSIKTSFRLNQAQYKIGSTLLTPVLGTVRNIEPDGLFTMVCSRWYAM